MRITIPALTAVCLFFLATGTAVGSLFTQLIGV